jgi:hypothetical protein
MLSNDEKIILFIVAGTLMLLLLGLFIIGFLFLYQKKHNGYIAEQRELKSFYNQELLKTKIEVQEQTLHYISQELHDNVNQILSFVKLNLGLTKNMGADQKQVKIEESRELIAQAISDLRSLSQSLNSDAFTTRGFIASIELDLNRIKKSGILDTSFAVDGDPQELGEQRELVLFRIFQESLNNVLKHANASSLAVNLQYSAEMITLTIEDDGNGFLANGAGEQGLGLRNIKSRAALIGAQAEILSEPNKGCCVKITIDPLIEQKYADSNYSNSVG